MMRDPIVFPTTSLGLLRGSSSVQQGGNVNQQTVFGTNLSWQVRSGYYARVIDLWYHVDINAGGVPRFLGHRIDDGAQPYFVWHAPDAWGPSANTDYHAHIGCEGVSTFNGAAAELGPLPNVWLPPGWFVRTDVLNLVTAGATDHVFSFTLLYEQVAQDEVDRLYKRVRQRIQPQLAR